MTTGFKTKKIERGHYEYRGFRVFKGTMYVGYIMAPVTGRIPCWYVRDLSGERATWTTDTVKSAKAEIDLDLDGRTAQLQGGRR